MQRWPVESADQLQHDAIDGRAASGICSGRVSGRNPGGEAVINKQKWNPIIEGKSIILQDL